MAQQRSLTTQHYCSFPPIRSVSGSNRLLGILLKNCIVFSLLPCAPTQHRCTARTRRLAVLRPFCAYCTGCIRICACHGTAKPAHSSAELKNSEKAMCATGDSDRSQKNTPVPQSLSLCYFFHSVEVRNKIASMLFPKGATDERIRCSRYAL